MAKVENKELRDFAEEKRAEVAGGPLPKRKPLTPAQQRQQALERKAQEDAVRAKEVENEARALVDLIEGQMKPGIAALVFGEDRARFFDTSATDREKLVDPLANYFRAIDFKPTSPTYYLSLLIATWSFLTYAQYQAMREDATRQPNEKKEKESRWASFAAQT